MVYNPGSGNHAVVVIGWSGNNLIIRDSNPGTTRTIAAPGSAQYYTLTSGLGGIETDAPGDGVSTERKVGEWLLVGLSLAIVISQLAPLLKRRRY
jgi:hypothetical protein